MILSHDPLRVLVDEVEPFSFHQTTRIKTLTKLIERRDAALKLIINGTPEARKAFCKAAGIQDADSKAIAAAGLISQLD